MSQSCTPRVVSRCRPMESEDLSEFSRKRTRSHPYSSMTSGGDDTILTVADIGGGDLPTAKKHTPPSTSAKQMIIKSMTQNASPTFYNSLSSNHIFGVIASSKTRLTGGGGAMSRTSATFQDHIAAHPHHALQSIDSMSSDRSTLSGTSVDSFAGDMQQLRQSLPVSSQSQMTQSQMTLSQPTNHMASMSLSQNQIDRQQPPDVPVTPAVMMDETQSQPADMRLQQHRQQSIQSTTAKSSSSSSSSSSSLSTSAHSTAAQSEWRPNDDGIAQQQQQQQQQTHINPSPSDETTHTASDSVGASHNGAHQMAAQATDHMVDALSQSNQSIADPLQDHPIQDSPQDPTQDPHAQDTGLGVRILPGPDGNATQYAIRLKVSLPPGIDENNIGIAHIFTMSHFHFEELLAPQQMAMPSVNQFLPENRHYLARCVDSPRFASILQYKPGTFKAMCTKQALITPVQQYAQPIYEQFFADELRHAPFSGYLYETQTTLSPQSRAWISDWLVELSYHCSAPSRLIYFSLMLLDRFLSVYDVSDTDLPIELWAIVCFFIACKYDNLFSIRLDRLLSLIDRRYTPAQVHSAERFVLTLLEYKLTVPTSADFLDFIYPYASLPPTGELLAKFILEVAIQQPFTLHHRASSLAASVLFLTRFILCTQVALSDNYTLYTSVYETHIALLKESEQEVNPFFHPLFKAFLPLAPLSDAIIREAVQEAWPQFMVDMTGYQLPILASCVISTCAALVNVMGFGPNPSAAFYNRLVDEQNQPVGNEHCLSDDVRELGQLPQEVYTLLYRMNELWEYGPDRVSLGSFLIPVGPHAPLVQSARAVFVKYSKPQFECIASRFLPPFDLRYEHFLASPEAIAAQKQKYQHQHHNQTQRHSHNPS